MAAATAAVERYNDFGGFQKNLRISFNPAVPTADGNFNGNIRIGPTIGVNERLLIHEINHTVGIGTVSGWNQNRNGNLWRGAQGLRLVRQFEGEQAVLNADTFHFWPYGLNFNNEDTEIARQRSVALVYAMRADMGLGASAHPSPAQTVNLTASDPTGESSFRRQTRWDDGAFPHEGADYLTGGFLLRTPQEPHAFVFAGDSLRVADSQPGTGLWFSGTSSAARVTVDNLILAGGWIEHRGTTSGAEFILDGSLEVDGGGTFRPALGDIRVRGPVTGSGDLHLANGASADRAVRFEGDMTDFRGNIVVHSGLELGPNASMTFLVQDGGTGTGITGNAPGGVLIESDFAFDIDAPNARVGDTWAIVDASNSAFADSFSLDGFFEFEPGVWIDFTAFRFTESTGQLVATGPCPDVVPDLEANFFDVIEYLRLTDGGAVSPLTDVAPLGAGDGQLTPDDVLAFLGAVELGLICN